jgi:hypothetical protein
MRTQFLFYALIVSILAAGSGIYGILEDLVFFHSAPAILLAGFMAAFFWKLLPNRKFDRKYCGQYYYSPNDHFGPARVSEYQSNIQSLSSRRPDWLVNIEDRLFSFLMSSRPPTRPGRTMVGSIYRMLISFYWVRCLKIVIAFVLCIIIFNNFKGPWPQFIILLSICLLPMNSRSTYNNLLLTLGRFERVVAGIAAAIVGLFIYSAIGMLVGAVPHYAGMFAPSFLLRGHSLYLPALDMRYFYLPLVFTPIVQLASLILSRNKFLGGAWFYIFLPLIMGCLMAAPLLKPLVAIQLILLINGIYWALLAHHCFRRDL